MLYQTHHPFSFPCNPFFSSASPKFPSSSSSSSSQVEKGMGCVVKGGFTPKMILEDVCCNFTPQNAAVPVSVAGDDFFVDQLLNFNNDDEQHQQQLEVTEQQDEQHGEKKEDGVFLVVKQEQIEDNEPSQISPPLDTVLSVPAEEADLEWLSHFVEESFSQFSNPYPPGYQKPKPELKPECRHISPPSFSKARRSKRARTGGRVWPTSFSEASTSSSHSSHTTTAPSSPCSSGPNLGLGCGKKQRKREGGPGGGPPRRCSHCGVQKTPQWRQGPNGAKTLCNACGVRYKSGRLFPEYRPACSPTFSSELHSNSHRKVLEMRKKKEMPIVGRPVPGFHRPVSSFG